MRFTRPALAVAVVVLAAALSAPALAAGPRPPATVTVADMKGDANLINSQGLGLTDLDDKPIVPPQTSTSPAQVAGSDIVSLAFTTNVTVKRVGRKLVNVPTGLKIVMTLSAPPQGNMVFRATPEVGPCTTFDLSYQLYVGGKTSSWLRNNCPGFKKALPTSTYEDVAIDSVVVSGNKITWTMKTGKSLPKFIQTGAVFKVLSGHVRGTIGANGVGVATAPVFDEISSTKTFTYGR